MQSVLASILIWRDVEFLAIDYKGAVLDAICIATYTHVKILP